MAQPCYSASAPGSLILMGEYAVLQGHPCLVMAINKTLTVSITPNASNTLRIKSELLEYTSQINQLEIKAPLEYVLTTLQKYTLPSGADIIIKSDIPPTQGLGSSAAVTVALIQALNTWLSKKITKEKLFKLALAIIHQVQGKGSGADLAASIYGGVLNFTAEPFSVTPLTSRPAITVVYSGHKTTTTKALHNLSDRMNHDPQFILQTLEALGRLSRQAVANFSQNKWEKLGSEMSEAQNELRKLGVSTDKINEIVLELERQTTIFGAKLSGSGLGDCVIGLGELSQNPFGDNLLPLKIYDQGVMNVN